MPGWLKAISHLNPLTYEVDALRSWMLNGGVSVFGIGVDIGILLLITTVLVSIGGWIYPRIAV
jgi:ABC-2 type transport system permease protein